MGVDIFIPVLIYALPTLFFSFQEECARILLFRGADRMIKNYANQTAAEVAIIANNEQLSSLISDFSSSDVGEKQQKTSLSLKMLCLTLFFYKLALLNNFWIK